jgi:excisionase family DNA binding protein
MDIQCFSIKEVAAILRVSEKTIRRHIVSKRLRAQLVGGLWRIPRPVICARLGCSPPQHCLMSGRSECQATKGFHR